MRSTDECEMSRSCHERDVLEPGLQIAAQHAGEPAELLGLHRVALVRHRARALLGAGAERLLHLAHLGALEVADLGREGLDGGTHRRARVEQLGVAVAGDHLRGRHRRRARAPRTRRPRPRGRCWSRCRPRPRACRPRWPGAGPGEPFAVAVHLHGPERQLGPERGGLGVHAVGAPGHRHRPVGMGLGGDRRPRARRRRRARGRIACTSTTDSAVSTTSLDVRP